MLGFNWLNAAIKSLIVTLHREAALPRAELFSAWSSCLSWVRWIVPGGVYFSPLIVKGAWEDWLSCRSVQCGPLELKEMIPAQEINSRKSTDKISKQNIFVVLHSGQRRL